MKAHSDGTYVHTDIPRRTPGDSEPEQNQDASIGSLLKELAHEVPSLLNKEVALAKSEARESLDATKRGVAAVSVGGAVALGGFIVLLLAAVYALGNVVAPWLAALIVGGITLAVGLAMVDAGRRKFDAQALKPDRTMDALHKDKNALQGRTE
ncbi:phage holin family protein [Lysobacter sp. A3-1-A15]|uniref:phage holin family protein n=1 Tax=Novilysobacter viscosus TaxID=3098602 RepID=UPI002EDB2440